MENEYNIFIKQYFDNKNIIKDNSFKTIKNFMKIFKNNYINLYSSEQFEKKENFNFIFNKILEFNEDEIILNKEIEYLNIIFIEYITDKCKNLLFFENLFIKIIETFYLKKIFLNFDIFIKYFKFSLKNLNKLNNDDDNYNLKEKISNLILNINDKKRIEILNLIFYIYILKINPNLLLNNNNYTPFYIDIIFDMTNIIKLNINEINQTSTINSIQNSFNYLFNKHYFLLKNSFNENLFKIFLPYLIKKLSTNENNIYENFIYIINDILLNNSDNNNINNILPIIQSVLINNTGLLHQIAINILNNNNYTKNIDNNFLKKFISVFDVLDGFNSHLFKSLSNELEYIIIYIDNLNEDFTNENNLYFDNPLNYFIFLSRKIFNHSNTRIQKFFIKTICKLNLKNKIFAGYLTNDFMQIINSNLLYPENEINSYHSKIGLILEKFYTNYININFFILYDYLNGIGKYITNRKVSTYLINSIGNVIKNKEIIDLIDENNLFISYIEKIIDKHINFFSSYYIKFKYWNIFSEFILKTELNNYNNENFKLTYNKIYFEIINYMLNSNKDTLCIDYLYFGIEDNYIKNELFNKVLLKIKNFMKENYKIDNINNKKSFITENNLEAIPNEIINIIFYSICDNNIINEFIENNINKIFSDYIPKEIKLDILNDINIILELNQIFNFELNNNIFESFENIYLNLKNYLNNPESFDINSFELYEILLFNYIKVFKKSINDIAFNELILNKELNINKFSLKFIKMYLFNFLTCIHFNLFDYNSIKNNKNIQNNLNIIFNFLTINKKELNDLDVLLYIKNLTLCLIGMNYINLNYIINDNNINEIYYYFDLTNSNDVFYVMKYFEIYLIKNINNESNLEIFENYIEKGLKVLTDKKDVFTYINVMTFLKTLLNPVFLNNDLYINIILNTLQKVINLNENRIWLLLKLSTELLIDYIKNNIQLLDKYNNILIDFACCKETRGFDSFMIETSPYYIKSPFNLNVKKILPYSEKISKYGLYVRYGILIFFEELLDKNKDNEDFIKIILNMILNCLNKIDNLSGSKPEMEFTDKHRKKLRLSQCLITLGKIFNKNFDLNNNIIINNYEIINSITKSTINIINKINLFSVDYYINIFSIQLSKYSNNFKQFLYDNLSNPQTKAYIVTSSLIISSIALLEKYINEEDEINKIINSLTIQCTSNICNIRGYAQYFINKIDNDFKKINDNYLSNTFLDYLRKNQNIQKFFKKFNEKYDEYTFLLRNFSVENLLKNNFDELYCEIIPIDLNNQFRILSFDEVILDNQDYKKVSSSWRFVFDTQTEIEKILEQIPHEDFQKKYRPLSENIYHKNSTRKRHDIIVVASLIDKPPNLGGLARTCEVFNIGALTIPSEDILNNVAFLSAAASAEKLTPLISIPPCTIKEFIIGYKKMGYKIIGLEQTVNSVDIREFKFEEKSVIILGNEKQGIPQDIINLIDTCIVIPQYGEIRSLNVHVSAAIMLWNCINCLNNK